MKLHFCNLNFYKSAVLRLKMAHLKLQVKKVTAPFINEHLQKSAVTVEYGKGAELICPIEGQPEPMYTWLKGGVEINTAGSRTRKLSFPRVIGSDQGLYSCMAINRQGHVQTTTRLEVCVADLVIPS